MAINTRFRAIDEPQPIAPPVLFRQLTGEDDNSSDDDFMFSNPYTPSVSPTNMYWPTPSQSPSQ